MKQLLAPSNLEDLKRSGLNDQTIEASGIFTVPPADFKKYRLPAKAISAYAIPYPNSDMIRFRLFYEEGDSGPRYFQQKGSGNKLYIPFSITKEILDDNAIPLYITEGEKKALKACQEGLACVALSGLWNWSAGEKKLLSDFEKINLKDRPVFIVPDNDFEK